MVANLFFHNDGMMNVILLRQVDKMLKQVKLDGTLDIITPHPIIQPLQP